MKNRADFNGRKTLLLEVGLADELITVMASVAIGMQRIARAIRGVTFCNTSFLASGDSFYNAGYTDFSTWTEERAEINFDSEDKHHKVTLAAQIGSKSASNRLLVSRKYGIITLV